MRPTWDGVSEREGGAEGRDPGELEVGRVGRHCDSLSQESLWQACRARVGRGCREGAIQETGPLHLLEPRRGSSGPSCLQQAEAGRVRCSQQVSLGSRASAWSSTQPPPGSPHQAAADVKVVSCEWHPWLNGRLA